MAAVDDFISAHEGGWRELERLIELAGSDPRRLPADRIERLGQLYRHVTSDLALARRDFPRDQVVRYLNHLAGRAHPLLYRAPAGTGTRLARFFLQEVPRLVRWSAPFILAAFLLFLLPALAGFFLIVDDPARAEEILPAQVTMAVRQGRLWTEIAAERRSLFSSLIVTNNLQVALLAFAGGMLLGTLTTYILIVNGLSIGAIFGYTHAHGLSGDLAAFVAPHGYLELSVIFIAGGCGLQMGWAVLSPGLLSRRDALALNARRALLLLLGAAPLMIVAGLIEGFVSPSGLPAPLKHLIGAATGMALVLFLARQLGARRDSRSQSTTAISSELIRA